jgi:hypothetical protein
VKILVIVISLLLLSLGEMRSQEVYSHYELTQLLISSKDSFQLSLIIVPQSSNDYSSILRQTSVDKGKSIFSFSANFSQIFFRFRLNKIARQLVGDFLKDFIPDEDEGYVLIDPRISSIPIVSLRIPIQF